MNRLTKLFLSIWVASLVLAIAYPVIAERDKTDPVKEGVGIEISMDGRQPFTLSVTAQKHRLALLPVNGAKTSAVKVISQMEGGSIKFNFLAVLDKLPETPTCDNIKTLKTEAVASYVAREGDVIRVSDFEKFGVAPFTVKVMKMTAAQVCPDGCCCCGSTTCCPNPGNCLQCGSCGLCCNS
jgi:hypothetical protein